MNLLNLIIPVFMLLNPLMNLAENPITPEVIYLNGNFITLAPGVPTVKQALRNISDSVKTAKKGQWIFAACVSASQTKFAEKWMPTCRRRSPRIIATSIWGSVWFLSHSSVAGIGPIP